MNKKIINDPIKMGEGCNQVYYRKKMQQQKHEKKDSYY